jgi:hypothetical protein
MSPSEALIGYEIPLHPNHWQGTNNDAIESYADQAKHFRSQAIVAINRATRSTPIQSSYQVGNQVWLEATNLRLPHQKSKIAPKRYRPSELLRKFHRLHTT